MIKNVIYICLLALALGSCEQKDSFLYEEKAGLYFYVPDVRDGETVDPNALVKEVDFAFRKTGEWNLMWYCETFYGDSLKADTLRLVVSLIGKVSDQPREYNLKAVAVDGELPMTELQFQNPYILKANALSDTALVIIPRPQQRGEYAVAITFNDSENFDGIVSERNEYRLFISDRYPEPVGWDSYTYGEYSEEKYAFWVTVLGITYDYRWYMYDNGLGSLIAALEEYNATHPDAPKDFTFPGMN